MVAFATEAVAGLSRTVSELVHNPVLAQQGEGAIDGRQPDSLAPAAQPRVDLLSGCVVRLACQRPEDE